MNKINANWRRSIVFNGILILGVSLFTGTPPFAQDEKKATEPASPTKPVSAKGRSDQTLTYKPPLRGNPAGRMGGGTRGGSPERSVVLAVLTPDHVGLTTKEQPTLYWYTSQTTNYPVEFTIIENKAPKALLETRINPPTQAGIQKVRLGDYNAHLKTGTQYRWYIAVIPDPKNRSKDILAGGFIERIDLSETLQTRLSQASATQLASIYAEEGIWYDALSAISDSIDNTPSDAGLRAQRASLLEQVRLQQVADFDRASGK